MARYKPGKSGVASRKIRELKKDIKSESDKDRIKKLEEQLAILMAMRNQDMEGGKSVSDADVKRMKRLLPAKPPKRSIGASPPKTYDRYRSRMEDLNFKRNLPGAAPTRKKGGGKVHGEKKKKDMMGGGKAYASMNKRYANGGKVYPRKGNI